MKFAALISGGKDSIFAIIRLLNEGHELVCLANLYPIDCDELDSYMYQSVGHEIIDLMGEALDKPLYRRPIKGKPKILGLEYGSNINQEDEVEDMFELLKEIKEKYPEIDSVSSGAIKSTYQRNRVENICGRLGWISLAPLWNLEATSLLLDMIKNDMNSIIIKVASMGLGKVDLGKSLVQLEQKLLGLQDKYDIHCCGEGGEFESLTLDCPIFKKRIIIKKSEIIMTLDDGIQQSGYLKIIEAILEDKTEIN